MKNYIITRGDMCELYYASQSGIYSRVLKNSALSSPIPVNTSARGSFGLFYDESNCVHIISNNRSSDITYTLIRDKKISHHTLLSGKQNINVSDFQIKSSGGFLNLFYTATVGSERFLVHCVLGNNAQPCIVSNISSDGYFLFKTRVYFSNENSTLGYCDFSDGKISEFIPLHPASQDLYICEFGGAIHSVWKCGDDIVFDGEVKFTDKNAKMPIILGGESIIVMWNSGGIIHYISDNHKSPMRFISAGKAAELFCVQSGGEFNYFYGTYSESSINFFGVSDIFSHCSQCSSSHSQNENRDIERLKIMIDIIQREIVSIKNQVEYIKKLYKE